MSGSVDPGRIVAWWDGDGLGFGLVAGEEKSRLRLVVPRGKEHRIRPARVLTTLGPRHSVPGNTLEDRRLAGERVAEAESGVRSDATGIDVNLLWQIVAGSESSWTPQSLAELALESSSGEALAAVVVALIDDGVHFVRRGDSWEPRTSKAVDDLRLQRERVHKREQETREFLQALERMGAGESFQPTDSDAEGRFRDALEQVALYREAAPEAAHALSVTAVGASGIRFDRLEEAAFRLLRRLGRFESDDENLEIQRCRLAREFSAELHGQARDAADRGFSRQGRVDLTALETLSIDGPSTREIDDALSVERLDDGCFRLWVHIADPGAFVDVDGALDREAFSRGLTHYFPETRLNMFPAAVSEQAASLIESVERPALTFRVELDSNGRIREATPLRSIIRCRLRTDYDSADLAIRDRRGAQAEMLCDLFGAATARAAARRAAGAVAIHAPEVDVHVRAGGEIELERIEPDSPSRLVVSEAMILAGQVAADFCVARRIPAIYRRQSPPADLSRAPAAGEHDPVQVRAWRRSLKRAETGLSPGPHFSLGLAAYLQITSPLRRYQDLVNQRQITSELCNEMPSYAAEQLQRIAATTEQAEAQARRAERSVKRYWLLRYLESRRGEEVTGTIVETEPRPVVQLDETLREQPIPGLSDAIAGQRLILRVEHVNPRAGRLVLRRLEPGALE